MSANPRTLSGVLRQSSRRFADRPAFKDSTSAVTYAELDALVDRLAVRLRSAGAEPGQRVGLCLERGPLALVASAAMLRLGCAYVPIDVRHPVDRMRYILSGTEMALAVCDAAGRRLLADTALDLFDVSADDLVPGRGDAVDLADPNPGCDAYVMYTSGSTGRPKGVVVTQANVISLLDDATPLFPFGEEEIWPLMHAHTFDVSVWEMWAGITVGATLVALVGDAQRDPELLAETLVRHRVTWLHIVPSVFNQLAEVVKEENLRVTLRGVTFAGEAINYRSLRTWADAQSASPGWYNAYGITETTVHSTLKRITARDIAMAHPATPIGTGFANSPVIVLDEQLRPTPMGRTGAIFVGGRQVARCYLNDPELTAQQFVRLPGRPGRWYRSGDFAQRDETGELRYVGRQDDQVKVRGFRIELGELEHAARALTWVADAAAVVDTSARDEPALALFVVIASDVADPVDRLRRELATRLPHYMLPGQVLTLPSLPQNANGKRDRRALRAQLAR